MENHLEDYVSEEELEEIGREQDLLSSNGENSVTESRTTGRFPVFHLSKEWKRRWILSLVMMAVLFCIGWLILWILWWKLPSEHLVTVKVPTEHLSCMTVDSATGHVFLGTHAQ